MPPIPSFPRSTLQSRTQKHFKRVLEGDRVFFVKRHGQVLAYCAFGNSWLSDLYVAPEHQGQGLGTRLLNKAKGESSHRQLWTFQENVHARQFYERNGFVAAELTDGHANEEKQPDIRYVWTKSPTNASQP
jgi:putative acetyltransferase